MESEDTRVIELATVREGTQGGPAGYSESEFSFMPPPMLRDD